MQEQLFGGDKKVGQSIFTAAEKRLVNWTVPRVPKSIETWHLTLATVPISLGIVFFSWLANGNFRWLWVVSFLIFLQWVTDSLDGALGRYRNTGLIKWGYYMDHLLDYVFLCSILIGYSLMLPDQFKYLQFFLLAVFGAFMVNSYLAFAATNAFRISYFGIGPTEIRLLFIAVNTLLIVLGKTHLAGLLPYVLVASLCGLCVVVYRTQKEIWADDMRRKQSHE